MTVPNIFGSATSAIPLSQLDQNFATAITLGNTAVYLGNTTTSLGNVTLTNVTISSGNVTLTGANVSGTANISTLIVTGNVGIGTASASSPLNVVSASSSLAIAINGRSSDSLGAMYFYANNGSTQYATITTSATEFRLSSVPAAAVQTFHTNGSERMRLDASGNLGIGTTTPSSFALLTVENSSNARAGWFYVSAASSLSTPSVSFVKKDNNTTTSQVLANFYVNGSLTAQGQINANGASAAAFGSFSDRRLKENITDLLPQLANIMALRTVEFDYIESEGGGHQIGFIAQDVQQVYPDLVGEREDGMLTLTDLNKNDARLIKAIQEQQALITALTARITALEKQMTMTTTWKIAQLDRQTSDGLVTTAHYRVDAVDGEHSAGSYGTVGFERGDTFTAYDSLTEAQVIAWVKDKLEVADIEAGLQAQIDAQKNPVTATGVPW
jgi:hypothetical protein